MKFRKAATAFGIVVVVFTTLFYWLVLDGTPSSEVTYEVDFALVRQLANQISRNKALEIQVEKVAQFPQPRTLMVAGTGFEIVPMGVFAFRVVFKDEHLVIDTGYDEVVASKDSKSSPYADYYTEEYDRVQTALSTASRILITHSHFDHIGGLVNQSNLSSILQNVILTNEQLDAQESIHALYEDPTLMYDFKPLLFEKYAAIAPGVVLIKAPGHTPGSVMVFVQMANGQEYLFLGDIAWAQESVDRAVLRPRLVSNFFLGEDRDAVSAQIRFLHELGTLEPEIVQVAGHDNPQIEAYIANGLLMSGFADEAS